MSGSGEGRRPLHLPELVAPTRTPTRPAAKEQEKESGDVPATSAGNSAGTSALWGDTQPRIAYDGNDACGIIWKVPSPAWLRCPFGKCRSWVRGVGENYRPAVLAHLRTAHGLVDLTETTRCWRCGMEMSAPASPGVAEEHVATCEALRGSPPKRQRPSESYLLPAPPPAAPAPTQLAAVEALPPTATQEGTPPPRPVASPRSSGVDGVDTDPRLPATPAARSHARSRSLGCVGSMNHWSAGFYALPPDPPLAPRVTASDARNPSPPVARNVPARREGERNPPDSRVTSADPNGNSTAAVPNGNSTRPTFLRNGSAASAAAGGAPSEILRPEEQCDASNNVANAASEAATAPAAHVAPAVSDAAEGENLVPTAAASASAAIDAAALLPQQAQVGGGRSQRESYATVAQRTACRAATLPADPAAGCLASGAVAAAAAAPTDSALRTPAALTESPTETSAAAATPAASNAAVDAPRPPGGLESDVDVEGAGGERPPSR